MHYISKLQYTEQYDKEHTYTFSGPCIKCEKIIHVTVKGPDLYKYNQGEFIQKCFPYLSSGEREFLMSGICDSCFSKIFAEEKS